MIYLILLWYRWDYGSLHIGFGMVTLAWFHSSGQLNTAWTCCGTIMDMVICYLSQISNAFIGIQNAYSWGYCSYDGYWTVLVNTFFFNSLSFL